MQLLHRAAQWWQVHQADLDFIAACEKYWRGRQDGKLSEEQEKWLAWARKNADTVSPLTAGYPDPALDGPFDPEAVPFGGPYPVVRQMPDPPVFQQPERERSYDYSHVQPANPYPYWLRHQKR